MAADATSRVEHGTISHVPVVLVIGIIAILIGVFVVATGRGGELAYEHADHAPLDLGVISPTDVALLRPPTALWGYNMQVTDEALDRIARSVRDRDIEIAFLRRKLADLGQPVIGEPLSRPAPIEARPAEQPWVANQTRPADQTWVEAPANADAATVANADAATGTGADTGTDTDTMAMTGDETATGEKLDDTIAAEEQGW